jgi:Putative  PD-(D/E)XK family member, (DUF4420)
MPLLIETLWAELGSSPQRPVFRRVDEEHTLELYAGLDGEGNSVLLLVTGTEPKNVPTYGTLEITPSLRADGNWALLFRVLKPDLDANFAALCQDLIDASRNCTIDSSEFLFRRLARWRRLMELAKDQILPESELRGLLGELLFLKDTALPRFGAAAAVTGWVGPFAAPQDFVIGGMAVEIKVRAPGSHRVRISSLDQLDSNTDPLFLVVLTLSPSAPEVAGAFTPWDLVEALRRDLEPNPATRAEFNLRLREAGFEEHQEYKGVWYQVSEMRCYAVDAAFPRLVASMIPVGISAAIYDIDLNVCAATECSF